MKDEDSDDKTIMHDEKKLEALAIKGIKLIKKWKKKSFQWRELEKS